jgi:hypothetical protein
LSASALVGSAGKGGEAIGRLVKVLAAVASIELMSSPTLHNVLLTRRISEKGAKDDYGTG